MEQLFKDIADIEASLPEVPKELRIWVQDVTPEQLGVIMSDHGGRLALLSVEGGIFDTLAGRYSNGIPNLDLFLKAHSGSPAKVDRVSRPPVYIPRPVLTVAISPQPDVLRSLADKPGFRGRGLLARFIYALPQSPLGNRTLIPSPVPGDVERAYRDGVARLLDLAPPKDINNVEIPWILRLSPKAYVEWKDFQRSVEVMMREGAKLYRIRDWASKLPGAALRLAGIMHCVVADVVTDPTIQEDTMECALNLSAVLIDHALAVFDLMERDEVIDDAQRILRWIREREQRQFTVRDCFCALQWRFKTVDKINPAIRKLEDHGYLRIVPKESVAHRPSVVYEVNPKYFQEPV